MQTSHMAGIDILVGVEKKTPTNSSDAWIPEFFRFKE
jgi:hypothetical protein